MGWRRRESNSDRRRNANGRCRATFRYKSSISGDLLTRPSLRESTGVCARRPRSWRHFGDSPAEDETFLHDVDPRKYKGGGFRHGSVRSDHLGPQRCAHSVRVIVPCLNQPIRSMTGPDHFPASDNVASARSTAASFALFRSSWRYLTASMPAADAA